MFRSSPDQYVAYVLPFIASSGLEIQRGTEPSRKRRLLCGLIQFCVIREKFFDERVVCYSHALE